MLADIICYWKMMSFMALDGVMSFLRLKDVTNTCTSADPEGGGGGTGGPDPPWKITSYMGFYRE